MAMGYDIGNSVDSTTVIDHFRASRPMISSVADITDASPAIAWGKMVARRWAEVIVPSTVAPATQNRQSESIDTKWFRDSLATLAEAEDAEATSSGSDQFQAPSLEIAEYLIAHFAAWPPERRPSFCIDPIGRPSFSAKSEDYYLHLTIEDDCSLNWYAEAGGQEFSDAEDRTYRTVLSRKLANLAQL